MNRPCFSLRVLLLLLAGASLGFAPVPAAELPRNTNAIESLTPEQARKLLGSRPGVTFDVLTKSKPGKEFHRRNNVLRLNGLKSLDAETAKVLATHAEGSLLMPRLERLSADAAQPLAGYTGGTLLLSGLTAIDAETAEWLAKASVEMLDLHGLTSLDTEAATSLAKSKAVQLSLDGLTSLDVDAAEALATFQGEYLFLNGLTGLDARAAKALAGFKGLQLDLNGLTAIDADTAAALASFKGDYLWLSGLTSLDTEAATAIAQFAGESIGLREETMNDFLAQHPLRDTVAVHILVKEGHLPELTTLDADIAKTLATNRRWDGQLPGLTALESPDSVAIAQALATREGPLVLPNLTKLSPKTLTALIQKEDVRIPLIDTLELIAEPDGSPTDDFVIPEGFKERQREQQLEE